MIKLSEMSLYEKFPWSKPIIPDIDPELGFYGLAPWEFKEAQLGIIEKMFIEIEDWFTSRSVPVDIAIYEIKMVFDHFEVEFFSNTPEIRLIVERYKQFFEEGF
jgi:hypothetical protein